jgi:hypothetical protein
MLEAITIDGETGTVAYFDNAFQMVPKERATLAKVVFDNGARVFCTLGAARAAGGVGSGNFGHAGRPGEIGGSAESSLADQREAGITAVGKLLEQAVSEAKFSYDAPTWDDLDGSKKDEIADQWKQNALESGTDIDTSGLDADVISDLRHDNETIVAATEERVAKELSFEDGYADWPQKPALPFDEQNVAPTKHAIDLETLTVDSDTGHGASLVDLEAVRFTDGTPLTPAEQALLQSKWDDAYQQEFDKASEEAFQSEGYYERRNELEYEVINDQWNEMSDEQKYEFGQNAKLIGEDNLSDVASEPSRWKTGTQNDTENDTEYQKTRAVANKLAELRTNQLYQERGLTGKPFDESQYTIKERPSNGTEKNFVAYDSTGKAIASSNTVEQLKENLKAHHADQGANAQALISEVWGRWKNSSANDHSLTFQLAVAKELGGNHRISKEEEARLMSDTTPTEFAQMQAYARAQWETTQYVMRRAGLDHVQGLSRFDAARRSRGQHAARILQG